MRTELELEIDNANNFQKLLLLASIAFIAFLLGLLAIILLVASYLI